MLADVGARKSLGFRAVVASERGYAQLRGWRNRLRDGDLVDPAEAAQARGGSALSTGYSSALSGCAAPR